jgi:xylulokinase
MADVTGRRIETVENAQDVGTMGAAVVCGVGLGIIPDFRSAADFIRISGRYEPRTEYKKMYDKNFRVFRSLYKQNKKLFRELNAAP